MASKAGLTFEKGQKYLAPAIFKIHTFPQESYFYLTRFYITSP